MTRMTRLQAPASGLLPALPALPGMAVTPAQGGCRFGAQADEHCAFKVQPCALVKQAPGYFAVATGALHLEAGSVFPG